MLLFSYLLLLFAIIIDLFFYVPIKIHLYIDDKAIYLYVFSLAILRLDNKKYINNLKNKIDIDKIMKTNKEDLKIVNSINIYKINISLNYLFANKLSFIIYPLIPLNYMLNKLDFKINETNKVYIAIKVRIINFLHELIIIRRLKKNERKSY